MAIAGPPSKSHGHSQHLVRRALLVFAVAVVHRCGAVLLKPLVLSGAQCIKGPYGDVQSLASALAKNMARIHRTLRLLMQQGHFEFV